MAPQERKRQAQLARKRQKKSVRGKGGSSRSSKRVRNPLLLSEVRSMVIREVKINADWRESGEATLVLARETWLKRSTLLVAAVTVDLHARGVVEATVENDWPETDYHRTFLPQAMGGVPMVSMSAEDATALLYQAIEQARTWGFSPCADWGVARLMFPTQEKGSAGFEVSFGREGRPVLHVGAGEDETALRAVLDGTVGAGNYDLEKDEEEAE